MCEIVGSPLEVPKTMLDAEIVGVITSEALRISKSALVLTAA